MTGGTPPTIALEHDLTGSGPLLVAVHGLTEDRTFWDAVALSDHFTTLRVDLRGHGRSRIVGPYDPVTLANDIHALLASVKHDTHARTASVTTEVPPLLLGHSYGAVVATAYASRFPVRAVVGIDQRLDVSPLPDHVAQAVRGGDFAAFMDAFFAQSYGQLGSELIADLRARRRVRQEVVMGAWTPLLDLAAADLTVWMRDLLTMPRPTPYLSLHGLPLDQTYPVWLRQRIPGAVLEEAPVRTHYPHLADPEWFLRRLVRFSAEAGDWTRN